MLGKLSKLRIRTCASKDLCVPRGDHAPALVLKRHAHDCRAAASGTRVDDLVNEVNELIWKAHSYLLAHPNMVADCYQYLRRERRTHSDGWILYGTDAKTSVPEAGRSGRRANPATTLDRLVEELIEPVGRAARRRAAKAIRNSA
jgi:RecB family endonuclease NucS